MRQPWLGLLEETLGTRGTPEMAKGGPRLAFAGCASSEDELEFFSTTVEEVAEGETIVAGYRWVELEVKWLSSRSASAEEFSSIGCVQNHEGNRGEVE